MTDYIFPGMFAIFTIFSFSLSKSKSNYQKLVANNGEAFAHLTNKILKIGGYLLFLCALIRLCLIFLDKQYVQP